MSQDLVSSAPGIYTAFLGIITAAANALNPSPEVFSFELGQYEPGSYITVHEIMKHVWEPESLGYFSFKEHYDIVGIATVFTGSAVVDDPTVGAETLAATYSLFQSCVMVPAMTNRTMPIFDTTGPTPYQMLPGFTRYTGGPGRTKDGQPWGWMGVIEWSFHFDAYITPA